MKIFNYWCVFYVEICVFFVYILMVFGLFFVFLGVVVVVEMCFVDMFWWFGLVFVVDGIDGLIVCKVWVKEVLFNWFGDMLDNVIDYVIYVLLLVFVFY